MFKGRSPEAVRAIADGVHAALVETFSVPPNDRFQVIEQKEAGEIIFDPSYLGVERSDGIVVVNIIASRGRDTAAKQALYRAIADRLASDPGVRREDVQIIRSPNERPDWSFGNGIAHYVEPAADPG